VFSDVMCGDLRIGIFVGFTCTFLLGILIFKGLTARRLYKSFGVKGLMYFKHNGMFSTKTTGQGFY
jgi:hypothetical protein